MKDSFYEMILAVSTGGILLSLVLIIMGSRPCDGDGCMIRFLMLGGLITIVIFLFFFFIGYRKLKK